MDEQIIMLYVVTAYKETNNDEWIDAIYDDENRARKRVEEIEQLGLFSEYEEFYLNDPIGDHNSKA